ncbi:protein-serine/threonine phosphatase [Balamuthia mandrillaris]
MEEKAKKKSSKKGDDPKELFLSFGGSELQGRRSTMEDVTVSLKNSKLAFFGVFDGHGGRRAADHCAKNLHKHLLAEPALKEKRYKKAIRNAFLQTDSEFCQQAQDRKWRDGSTAAIVLLKYDRAKTTRERRRLLLVANVGDTRVVACRQGKAKPLTVDHKPLTERERIEKYGGCILGGNVNGVLAVSRAIGDVELKPGRPIQDNPVTAQPDVWKYEVTDDLEFLLLACDGVWDVFSNDDAVKVVRKALKRNGGDANAAAEALTNEAYERKSTDNISALVVVLNPLMRKSEGSQRRRSSLEPRKEDEANN